MVQNVYHMYPGTEVFPPWKHLYPAVVALTLPNTALITNKAYQSVGYYQNIAVASLPSPSKYLLVLSCLMEDHTKGFVSDGVLEFVSQGLGKFLWLFL